MPDQHPAGSPKALNAAKILCTAKRYNYCNIRRLAMSNMKNTHKKQGIEVLYYRVTYPPPCGGGLLLRERLLLVYMSP